MKKKGKECGILILCTLMLWGCLYGCLQMLDRRKESAGYEEATAYLKEMADKDMQQISKIVNKADKEIALAKVDSLEEALRIHFSDAVFIGDSIIEGISGYQLLAEDHVVAMRGKRTDNCEDDVEAAIALAPQQLFMLYGMNDLEYCRGDALRFASQYQELLTLVKEKLPNTDIFVLSILPIHESAIKNVPVYGSYPDFNQALADVCKEEKVTFLDLGHLLTSADDYEFDGVHPKYAFYPLWLMEIAKEAGL